jgi:hypothetical protein
MRSEHFEENYDHRDRGGHQQQEPLFPDEGKKLTKERFHRHLRNHTRVIAK